MPTVDVVNTTGDTVGTMDLDEVVFGSKVKPHLFHAVVRYQRARARGGSHKVKGRAEIRGGGRKPFRQKGTGRARQGTTRAPQWRGGGVVHGPHNRSHAHKLPKKVRRAALRGALSKRCSESALTVFDDFVVGEAKTRAFVAIMQRFEMKDLLLVLSVHDESVLRSARNIPGVTVLPVEGVNVYDILRHGNLAMTQAAATRLAERLGA